MRSIEIALIASFVYLTFGFGQTDKPSLDEGSRYCLRCHGNEYYTLTDSASGKTITRQMYDVIRIDTAEYLQSNHKTFTCTDCHSSDFSTFPHPVSLRFEEMWACMDCYGGDEKYAKFHFEEIEKEYQQSIHHQNLKDAFSCWDCHNPHTYKINVRNTDNILNTIAYDNDICLSCHSDFSRFQLLTKRKEINLIEKHDWLPNQSLHFSQVRCIECHAELHDSILVAHMVKPKEKAVKRCVECHSANSILMASLYKYKTKESRREGGFLNAIILNNSYVIGANRNVFLNIASIVIFCLALLGIVIHLALRIKSRKNHS
jgi:hypothetical protein